MRRPIKCRVFERHKQAEHDVAEGLTSETRTSFTGTSVAIFTIASHKWKQLSPAEANNLVAVRVRDWSGLKRSGARSERQVALFA